MGNAEISWQLRSWWKTHRRGRTTTRSGGFFLPDGSMLSPDAAYVLPQKLKGLTKDDLTGFPYLCPDFIIELLSASDSLPKAQQKMERWMENGVALGWLIDPYKKRVYVYEPGREAAAVSGKTVQGSGPVEGFTLDLDEALAAAIEILSFPAGGDNVTALNGENHCSFWYSSSSFLAWRALCSPATSFLPRSFPQLLGSC